MNLLEPHQDNEGAGLVPVMMEGAQEHPLTIEHPETADALALKGSMDQHAPESRYAAYYYAMNFLFLPETSLVARDDTGKVVGSIVSLYDFEFKKLIVSHVAASLALA